MNRKHLVTVAVCLFALLLAAVFGVRRGGREGGVLTVGFLYENDESTPGTYNFSLAASALRKTFGDRVQILTRSNVRESDAADAARELALMGCGVIFTNSHASTICQVAGEFPEASFCQVSTPETAHWQHPKNFHTFNGRICEGWYAAGVAAGMKLRELEQQKKIPAGGAVVGFVSGRETAEEISAFTAFLLGVRSEAPQAVMRVRYTGTESSYTRERAIARALIEEGCAVIAQHTPTIGPALACEEAAGRVYHVGYSMSMVDVATATSLLSARVNFAPYVTGVVRALLSGNSIEGSVPGEVHGQDLTAGFERDWVELLDLNLHIAAEGTKERLEKVTQELIRGKIDVFRGDYLGTDPDNPQDVYDLSKGYAENRDGSWATFHYILQDVITVER